MYNILTLNRISPVGLSYFDRDKYTYSNEEENPDAVIVRSASMHDMEFGSKLKAIARAGAGTNNIPVERFSEQGIVVFNTPGANANAVMEMVLLGLLISSRKVAESLDWLKSLKGEGDEVPKLVEKGKSQFAGPELKGKKLGVIGLGAIGVLVCNAAVHLGMEVHGYDPYISVDAAWGLSRGVKHVTSLEQIYSACDYISLHVPCNKETKEMINSESIALMKNGVRILNFARGELVSDDILEAISNQKVNTYVTDFPKDQYIGVKGIVAFPHLGASTPESEDNCAKMAAKELRYYLENGDIRNSVNFPNAQMPRSGDERICIVHKNVKAMISKITTIVSDHTLNIDNLLNKSKGDYAYTMVDVTGSVNDALYDALKAVEGIIRIRVLR